MFGKNRKTAAVLMSMAAMLSAVAGTMPPVSTMTANAASKVIAFPGAVGGGKYATGGRGGEVYHVTNLNDSGAGSFRDAVSKPNRIVVFDVSGTIELKGNILCSDNVTVAGQTAPGGSGITLKNYKMGMSGDNIICRYISSRPGPYAAASSGNDAWGGAKGANSIIDHCSMGWTSDEQWGLYSNNTNYTVQYSVLGPADSWGGHKKGLHGFGIMLGKGDLTFDHNLIIHNVSRNFRGKVPDQYVADFTNNIIYDWGYQTTYGTIGHLNYVNNTLKAGNSTTGGYHWMSVDSTTKPQNFKVYCAGNRMINKDGTLHSITNDNWAGVTVKDGIGITKNDLYSATAFPINVNGENVSTATTCESAEASYDHVISFAGNGISPEKRTAIDRQCADETKNGTGQCSGTAAFDSSEEKLTKYNIKCGVTYTYPSAVLKKEITDKDNDGMDDNWELARGLDPSNPKDTNGDYCGKGYTNIEYYINDLTVDSFPKGVVELSPETASPAATTVTVPEQTATTTTEPVVTAPPATASLEGKLFKGVTVSGTAYPEAWNIGTNAQVGSKFFGDRNFTFAQLQSNLEGAEILMTACDAKGAAGDTASFTAGADMSLYVGLDSRVEKVPEWLGDYVLMRTLCTSDNDVTFNMYKKDIKAGEKVTLGGNGQTYQCVNYIVLGVPSVTAPEAVEGDINGDKEAGAADLVIMEKFLLGAESMTAEQCERADLIKDGVIDIFDLIRLRKVILSR